MTNDDLPKTVAEANAIGATHYFSGKPCRHGHVSRRRASTMHCLECDRKRSSARDREKTKLTKKASYKKNIAKVKERRAKSKSENPEIIIAASAAYYIANRDVILLKGVANRVRFFERDKAGQADWRRRNAARARKARALWFKNNRERVKASIEARRNADPVGFKAMQTAHSNARRARKANAEGHSTPAELVAIRRRQRDRCVYYPTKLEGGGHLDHIVALARGGSNWPTNLQWLCPPCNQEKNARDHIEFAQSKGILL